MAWETRNGRGSYYTRSKRVDGKVVREYMGTGLAAMIAAQNDVDERKKRQSDLVKVKEEKKRQFLIDRKIDEEANMVQALTKAILLINGYHNHKGQWRKRRDGKKDTS